MDQTPGGAISRDSRTKTDRSQTKVTVHGSQAMERLNSEKFQNLSFKPKTIIFWENDENDGHGEIPDFNEFTLNMIFSRFHENGNSDKIGYSRQKLAIFVKKSLISSKIGYFNKKMAIFVENFQNHI